MRPRRDWRRRARDQAGAERLRRERPGYHVVVDRGVWNAVHMDSLAVFGPYRSLRRLAREIEADAWQRPVRTAGGTRIAIRAAGR